MIFFQHSLSSRFASTSSRLLFFSGQICFIGFSFSSFFNDLTVPLTLNPCCRRILITWPARNPEAPETNTKGLSFTWIYIVKLIKNIYIKLCFDH